MRHRSIFGEENHCHVGVCVSNDHQESGKSSFIKGSGPEAAMLSSLQPTEFMTCPIQHLSLNLQSSSEMLKPPSKLHFPELKPNAGLTLIPQREP